MVRVKVYGEAAIAKFARKHASSRRPLQRFLEIARAAEWPHFPAVKRTFAVTDYALGNFIAGDNACAHGKRCLGSAVNQI